MRLKLILVWTLMWVDAFTGDCMFTMLVCKDVYVDQEQYSSGDTPFDKKK